MQISFRLCNEFGFRSFLAQLKVCDAVLLGPPRRSCCASALLGMKASRKRPASDSAAVPADANSFVERAPAGGLPEPVGVPPVDLPPAQDSKAEAMKKVKKSTKLQAAIREQLVPKARRPYALFTKDIFPTLSGEEKRLGKSQPIIAAKWKALGEAERDKYKEDSRKEFEEQKKAAVRNGVSNFVELPAADNVAHPGDCLSSPRSRDADQQASIAKSAEPAIASDNITLVDAPDVYNHFCLIRKAVTQTGAFCVLKSWTDLKDAAPTTELKVYQELKKHQVHGLDPFLPLLDYSHGPRCLWIALPYIPGCTLHQAVRRKPLTGLAFEAAILQMSTALAHLHSTLKIVHLSVNLKNALWEPDKQRLYLIDFGKSEIIHPSAEEDKRFIGPVGEAEYRAPELWHERIPAKAIRPCVDAWSLGCCVYEIATGKKLFAPKFREAYTKGPFPEAVEHKYGERDIAKMLNQWSQGHGAGLSRAVAAEACSRIHFVPASWQRFAWDCLNPRADARPQDLAEAAKLHPSLYPRREAP